MVTRSFLQARAEAESAAWIARLNADDRSDATDAALKAWLHADPLNEDAFERATEIWGMLPGAAAAAAAAKVDGASFGGEAASPVRLRRNPVMALAASLLLFLTMAGGWWLLDRPFGYSTETGEQKVATLKDGSRIALNTASSVRIDYREDVRHVTLDQGEAMFEVAPNPRRPFLVTAGDKVVRAVGTSFIVRKTGGRVVVTLIQGKVQIEEAGRTKALAAAQPPTVLAPGERLTVLRDEAALIDRPSIEAATAWRRGQAVFADTPLSTAAAELNRYGGPHVAIGDPRLASLRVSGVFATNDTAEFAKAISTLHGLKVEQVEGELRIVR